jgi:hypothetical protein
VISRTARTTDKLSDATGTRRRGLGGEGKSEGGVVVFLICWDAALREEGGREAAVLGVWRHGDGGREGWRGESLY